MSKRGGIASIAIALAIAFLASGSFYNQVYAEEAWLIQNLKSGRCLDARDPNLNDPNSLVNGTPIQLYDCHGGTMQQWQLIGDGQIRNVKSGRCLDATDPDPTNPNSVLPNETPIQLYDCHDGTMQQWKLSVLPEEDQYRNVKGGRCLDARDPDPGNPNSVLGNGTPIQLWDCWGGNMQRWFFQVPPLPANCNPAFQISGLFLERYRRGRDSVSYSHRLGCPTGPEIDHPDGNGGRYQTFEYGAMAYSPTTGPKSVQVGYSHGLALSLDWSTTDPFSYDRFTVRYDKDGQNLGQDDVDPQTLPNSGGWWDYHSGPLAPGLYRLVVEGCDNATFGGSNCNQGFSLPVFVRVR